MLTIRAAAQLLQNAHQPDGLVAIARACGLNGESLSLLGAARAALDLPKDLRSVCAASGTGALRGLFAEVAGNRTTREVALDLAQCLSRRSPHLFWMAFLANPSRDEVAILSWDSSQRPTRTAALHLESRHVLDSDAETLCALSAVSDEEDLARHSRWLDILGREALSRRFYRLLARLVDDMAAGATGGAPEFVRRELALLNLSRLLFLAFLQAKGWLDDDRDFLAGQFHNAMTRGRSYHWSVLRPLFFGTLNTPPSRRAPAARAFGRVPFLNGGLFSRTPAEKRWRDTRFSDEVFGAFHLELLARHRFTTREDSTSWSEAAIDPEMLGRAFESLMAGGTRKESGAYYTPQRIVERMTSDALAIVLDGLERGATLDRLCRLRVLDPSCGSGAFLVHALERLAAMRADCGEAGSVAELRRAVLVQSIFGVDVNPTAVWLCELRLWLSVVIESDIHNPLEVPPLPNLDRNVRVGDALAGSGFGDTPAGEGRAVQRLRERYVRAAGARKRTLFLALEREERRLAIRALDQEAVRLSAQRVEHLGEIRARDLWGERRSLSARDRAELADLRSSMRGCRKERAKLASGGALPFTFASHFADAAASGGFDLVIGNPPWVRVHRIPAPQRETLRHRYMVYRDSAWKSGASAASAGTGFGGQVDLASLFVERALNLTRPDGAIALLVPAKIFRTLAAGGVRQLLHENATLRTIDDFSEARSMFDAAVYPGAIIATRNRSRRPVRVSVHRRTSSNTWVSCATKLRFDDTPGSPLLLVPPDVRAAFDAVLNAGIPMSSSVMGRPTLGVKCGLNDAFIVGVDLDADLPLRPALRGESLGTWLPGVQTNAIIWTHDDHGSVLAELTSSARHHLLSWRRQLMARSDLRPGEPWWSLFRTEAASAKRHRVVWADLARAPRAAVLLRGDQTVPLNSCYVASCDDECDALAFCALLNSAVAAAWLATIAEPARGGYKRFLGWTMSLFPVPRDWDCARTPLAELARAAMSGPPPGADELHAAVLHAYRLRPRQLDPLLRWHGG